MKRQMERKWFLTLLLAVVIAGSLFTAVTAYATGESGEVTIIASGDCGQNIGYDDVKWQLMSDGTLTISGTGYMNVYAEFGDDRRPPWLEHRQQILKVVLSEGVESIGTYAFQDCDHLASIEIPESVTMLGSGAFNGCSSLESVTIPEGITSIGVFTFRRCGSLANVILPKSVESINSFAFEECKSLVSIEIPEGVTSIGHQAFARCSALKNITLPNSLTTIGDEVFWDCSSLTNITLPGNLTSIGHAILLNCSNLETVVFEEGWTSVKANILGGPSLKSIVLPKSVKSIECYAFSGCSNLVNIELQEGLASIGKEAFSGCESLEKLNIPDSVTEIQKEAFQGCSGLKSIVIPKNVTHMDGSAFRNCESLKTIDVDDQNQAFYSSDGILYNKEKTALVLYPGGREDDSFVVPSNVTQIGDFAFNHCGSLASVVLPEKLVSIGKYAFLYCESLASVTSLPETLTSIGTGAFSSCRALTSLTILSKSCVIYDEEDTAITSNTATIYGYTGSTAESHAKKYNRKFEALDALNNDSKDKTPGTGNVRNQSPSSDTPNPVVKVTKVRISGISHKIAVGKSITLKASVSPSNAANKSVTWKSSDKKYVTVSSAGKATAKKAGKTVTITATAKDGSGKAATYKITPVKEKVKGIKISGKKTVKAGKSLKLIAKVSTTGKNANKVVVWKSSNEKYATVNSKGKVMAKKAGKGKKVTITATATDGSGKKAKVTIKITK